MFWINYPEISGASKPLSLSFIIEKESKRGGQLLELALPLSCSVSDGCYHCIGPCTIPVYPYRLG